MEPKKYPITHQMIARTYQETCFKTNVATACIFLLAVFVLGYIVTRYLEAHGTLAILIAYIACLVAVAVILLLTLGTYKRNLSKLQRGEYEIVTDTVMEIVKGLPFYRSHRAVHEHQRPHLRFSIYGNYYAPYFLMNNSSTQEQEAYRYFHRSQIGDPFYLVLLNGRILQIYKEEEFYLPEE